jgi:hypothetical protein
MNTMHVEDFVVLGRTVPEDSKKYGQRVCMAGYSKSCNQFLRVYPLMLPLGKHAGTNGFKARHTYTVDLVRNEHDSRMESWRVQDELHPTSTDWAKAKEVKKSQLLDWLETKRVGSIQELNACKLSLGVLLVPRNSWEGAIVPREAPNPPKYHSTLFEDIQDQTKEVPAIGRLDVAPYIHFRDAASDHKLQVREWGAYQLLANPDYSKQPESLWNAPGYRKGKDLWIVVGNMANHRKNWMVIKTFEADEPEKPGLFDGATNEDE